MHCFRNESAAKESDESVCYTAIVVDWHVPFQNFVNDNPALVAKEWHFRA